MEVDFMKKIFACLFWGCLIVFSTSLTVPAEESRLPGDNQSKTIVSEANTADSVDVSKYTESNMYLVEKTIHTDYGTVLYYSPSGAPHGKNPTLILVKKDGEEFVLSQNVPRQNMWNKPELIDISLSDDGKYISFSASFDEKAVINLTSPPVVLHEAGTYYYTVNLETCEIKERFVPILTSDNLSEWAKDEVEKAYALGFVPSSLGTDLKRSITRGEFIKLATSFLSVQRDIEDFENEEKDPDDNISRQEAACMLMQIYKSYAEYNEMSEGTLFFDDDQIAAFAKSDVHAVNTLGIMRGVGENLFAPLDKFTVEQAIITLLRMDSIE
ncbi:MAG: hypothetical protein E7656_05725 [Ruminococcaceae bacterium]|nr:hypothetical protein [Oscillospiraceae bacterium]